MYILTYSHPHSAFYPLPAVARRVRQRLCLYNGFGHDTNAQQMSRKNRLIAFGGCLIAGLAISVLGSILFAFG
jgi:hypothetical protein